MAHPPQSTQRSALIRLITVLAGVMLTLIGALFGAAPTLAQETAWREQRTTYFVILFTAGNEADAETYAGFVDSIYDEMAVVFNHRAAAPITLRLYPTQEAYEQVNPLARDIPGIVAHANFRRREVVVILPRTINQTPVEVENNIRHELTHIIAAEITVNQLNVGFQEGIAQYIEHPSPNLERTIAMLRAARDQGSLMTWSELDDREKIYGEPQIGYPQSLSIVAFLVERYGFEKFREFLAVSASSSGYRSALQQTYAVASTDLEQQWNAWLPDYIAGGYNLNALRSYDFSHARQLLEQGQYEAATAELEQALEWLANNATANGPEVLAEAEALLEYSREGSRAERMARAARTALEHTEYERAQQLVAQARAVYTALGDTRRNDVMDTYDEHAVRGMSAMQTLDQAAVLVQRFQIPQARAQVDVAAAEFAALGDETRLNRALVLRRELDTRQQFVGVTLIALGLVGAVSSLGLRWSRRKEAEFWV